MASGSWLDALDRTARDVRGVPNEVFGGIQVRKRERENKREEEKEKHRENHRETSGCELTVHGEILSFALSHTTVLSLCDSFTLSSCSSATSRSCPPSSKRGPPR